MLVLKVMAMGEKGSQNLSSVSFDQVGCGRGLRDCIEMRRILTVKNRALVLPKSGTRESVCVCVCVFVYG